MTTSYNWIDRFVAYVSPTRGAARAQARAMIETFLAYEGATKGRRGASWRTQSTSGDTEAGRDHRLLRDRARDLVRNNPHATKGLNIIVANKIGTGIMCQPAGAGETDKQVESSLRLAASLHPTQAARVRMFSGRPNRRKANRLYDRFLRWSDRCDLMGQHDLFGIQALAERTRCESGEALIRLVQMKKTTGPDDVPLRLQVLEPDLIDSDKNVKVNETTEIRYGIELKDQVPVAYWLYEAHPGDQFGMPFRRGKIESNRIPIAQLIHYFKPSRPGMTRGVTDFAPVMMRLLALADYDDAEVMRKRIAACLAAFVTTPGGMPASSIAPTNLSDDGFDHLESMQPGMIAYMKPGESVVTSDPRPSIDYEPFNKVQLRSIAAGLGIPYELLSGDLSEVNYTSHRGGLVQFRGAVEADQWQVLIPQVCSRICNAFAFEAGGMDGMIDPDVPWIYTPPRFGLLDPAKEVPATIEAIQGGLISYPNAIRREGYDWHEVLDEIEEFQTEVESRDIRLTTVPPEEPPPVAPGGPPGAGPPKAAAPAPKKKPAAPAAAGKD